MNHRAFALMLMNAIVATSALAQPRDQRPPPQSPSEMARTLGLDAAATATFVGILREQHAKHRALREIAKTERSAMHQNQQALHQETLERLKTVLSADQIARFETLRPRPPQPGPGAGCASQNLRPPAAEAIGGEAPHPGGAPQGQCQSR
ncbi:MAG: hypothetical protein JNN30_09510 [Rhodanobacteraceae bacterium]|nr:hypothetical protein [Rhodanobacteraceae bacterium]